MSARGASISPRKCRFRSPRTHVHQALFIMDSWQGLPDVFPLVGRDIVVSCRGLSCGATPQRGLLLGERKQIVTLAASAASHPAFGKQAVRCSIFKCRTLERRCFTSDSRKLFNDSPDLSEKSSLCGGFPEQAYLTFCSEDVPCGLIFLSSKGV